MNAVFVNPVPVSALDELPGYSCRGDATDDTRPASELAAQGGQPAEHAPSGEALSALTLLLEACLSTHHMPTLEDMAKELQQEGKAGEACWQQIVAAKQPACAHDPKG